MKTKISEKKKMKRSTVIFMTVILAFPLLNFLVFYVFININTIILAFQNIDKDYNYTFAGLSNIKSAFIALVNDPLLFMSVKNSFILFFATLIIGFPLTIMFAYIFYKKYIANKMFLTILMLPSFLSAIIISLVFLKFTENALPDMLNRIFGITAPYFLKDPNFSFPTIIVFVVMTGFATSVIIYLNAMTAISPEIIESGKVDGVSHLQELLYIILPLVYPTILTFTVTGVASIFVSMGPLYIFYAEAAPQETYLSGYYLFIKAVGLHSTIRDYPYLSAVGIIFTLIATPLTLIVKKKLEDFDPMKDGGK
jgi:ABC-type sugar transport system permease subunit